MVTFAAFGLALAGFLLLAASMHKHHRDLFGKAPSWRRAALLRIFGWLLLAGSLATAIAASDPAVGLVLWFGLATIAALAVALGFTYGPRPGLSTVRTATGSRRAVAHLQSESLDP